MKTSEIIHIEGMPLDEASYLILISILYECRSKVFDYDKAKSEDIGLVYTYLTHISRTITTEISYAEEDEFIEWRKNFVLGVCTGLFFSLLTITLLSSFF